MRTLNSGKQRWVLSIVTLSIVTAGIFSMALQQTSLAASGSWSETTGDGAWSSGANWTGGIVADGADNTATFAVDVSAVAVNGQYPGFFRNAVEVDGPRTIGSLTFGDANTSTPGGWELYSADAAANVLTLAGTSPTITVAPLGPIDTVPLGGTGDQAEVIDDARFTTVSLAGTSGFTKMGNGILTLMQPNANLTGNINVNEGTLRLRTGASFDFETAATPAVTRFVIANGATLETQVSLGQNAALPAAAGVTVPAGATATLRNFAANSQFFANVQGGAGSTLNYVSTVGNALTGTVDRDWSGFANVNFTGTDTTQSQVRLRPNGGTFNGNSFANTNVTFDNVLTWVNQSTGGNTLTFGAINGTTSATIRGGTAGVGSSTFIVGGLNTNATFAGNIEATVPAAPATDPVRSLNFFKVGTGVWELSGNQTYSPANDLTPNRRGGITRIEAGTIKLSGSASLPAGVANALGTDNPQTPLGDLYSSLDIRAGATFDVSTTTTPYSTPALHQVVGAGTIVGNYNHDEGILAPGDGLVGGNTAALVNTVGTLTFANNLSFAGTGAVMYSMGPTGAGANDLIQVNGTTNLTGSVSITPTFTGAVPAAGQVYTVVSSSGGFGGTTPAGWTIQWPGRGAGPTPVVSGNNVQFTSAAVVSHSLNWSGQTSGVWNTSTQNWYNNTTSGADEYVEFDNVTFGDTFNQGSPTPVSNSTISLGIAVNPTSVTVNSNSTNYTIGGTGRIAGNASLTKSGTSTLTMTTGNTYSGGTTISGGAINRDANGSLGTGSITLSGGELQSRGWTTTNPIVVPTGQTGKLRTLGGVNASPLTPGDVTVVAINTDGAISGSGNLELHNDSLTTNAETLVQGPQVQAMDVRANNSGFNGSVSFKGTSPIALRLTVAGAEGSNAAWDLGNNGSSVGVLFGVATPTTVRFGSLSGGAASPLGAITNLQGRNSGAGISPVVYEIGALNTDTTFAGNILSGRIDGARPENTTSLTKVGTGKLTLSGMDESLVPTNYVMYQGDTRVQGGTLSIQRAYLANDADVFISNGAKFELDFAGNDVIDSLYLNGVPQTPGLYGLGGLGSSFFLGTGFLQVTTLGPTLGLVGDYNNNGTVDAADYTIWRNNNGTGFALANRDPANTGNVSQADYNSWKANFGATSGGSGSLAGVPEPTSFALVLMALGLAAGATARRRG